MSEQDHFSSFGLFIFLVLLLVWAPVLGLLYQNQDLEKKIKAIKCW